MAHFAKIENGLVAQVIVAEQEFIDSLPDDQIWIQTSYNTRLGKHYDPLTKQEDGGIALRKNYAGLGMIYDAGRDAFYQPQPWPSWTLDEDTCGWQPPTPYPDDGKFYAWNESGLAWEEVGDYPPIAEVDDLNS